MELLNDEEPSMIHLKLMPNTINPFWPIEDTSDKKKLIVRPIKTDQEIDSKLKFSSPFWYNSNHKTLLKLKDNVCLFNLFLFFFENPNFFLSSFQFLKSIS
jgi:hypothetical protein